MKKISQCAAYRRLCDALGKLSRYRLRTSCSATMVLLEDETAPTPEHRHTMECSMEQNLWKALAILGALLLFFSALKKLCSLFCSS